MSLNFSQLKHLNVDGIELIRISIGAYNNLIPSAIDTDGSIFNGCGYINGYRLSSSGALKTQENTITTGFIPYTQNCAITMLGVNFTKGYVNGYHYLTFFDKNFNKLCHLQLYFNSSGSYSVSASGNPGINASTSIISSDEYMCTTIKPVFNASTSNIAYFRINGNGNGSSMIVSTSNEDVDKYTWKRQFVNLVTRSIDVDGSIYNGYGYMKGCGLIYPGSNSIIPSVGQQANTIITGYIPATKSDKIRMSGVSWIPSGTSGYCISFYNSDFNYLGSCYHVGNNISDRGISSIFEYNGDLITNNNSSLNNVTTDANGVITFNFEFAESAGNSVRYIRISAGDIGSDMIVTKNEEII